MTKSILKQPSSKNSQEKGLISIKFKFEGFFLIGFFLLVFFLLAGNLPIAAIGIVLMLFAFFVDSNKQRFLTRDIYILTYAFSTTLVVFSFLHTQLLALFIGTTCMLLALLLFTLHKKKILQEKHKKILKKNPEHKFVPSRASKVNVFFDANLWSIISIVLLVFSGILGNKIILIIGLLTTLFSLFLHSIKIRTVKKKWRELAYQNIIAMKKDIAVRHTKYETDFDRLLLLVQKYQTLRISDVAKIFNISLEKAEEWGKIMEENGLLIVHFPPIGEAELQWK